MKIKKFYFLLLLGNVPLAVHASDDDERYIVPAPSKAVTVLSVIDLESRAVDYLHFLLEEIKFGAVVYNCTLDSRGETRTQVVSFEDLKKIIDTKPIN